MTKLVNYYFCCPKWPTFVFPKRPNNQLCIKFQYDTIYGLFLVCIPKWPINQLHINSQNDQVGKILFLLSNSLIFKLNLVDLGTSMIYNWLIGHFGSLGQISLTWSFAGQITAFGFQFEMWSFWKSYTNFTDLAILGRLSVCCFK